MGRKYSIKDQQGIYFVTFTVIKWLDLFIRDQYKEIFIESLRYCQENKGLKVYGYCVMTSHVHLILSVEEGNELSGVIRDIKSFTSRKIRLELEGAQYESRREFLLWMMKREGERNKRNKGFQFMATE